jgi:hypothetical protein
MKRLPKLGACGRPSMFYIFTGGAGMKSDPRAQMNTNCVMLPVSTALVHIRSRFSLLENASKPDETWSFSHPARVA